MFESAELGHRIDREQYRQREPALRAALLQAQFDLGAQKRFPVLIVIGGVDGAGKGETVNLLNEWMDPRHIDTHAFGAPSDEERERPRMWRFWRVLPPKGRIGILFGAWHTQPVLDRAYRRIDGDRFEQQLQEIERFEQMLSDEGVLLLKFWFHLSKKDQKARLKSLEKDPLTRWRVTQEDWHRFEKYDRFRKVSELLVRRTSTATAPWLVVEGLDECYRSLTVGETLLAAMRSRLDAQGRTAPAGGKAEAAMGDAASGKAALGAAAGMMPVLPPIDRRDLLSMLKLDQPMTREVYEPALELLQGRLNRLSRDTKFRQHSAVVVFEGSDAAGKGGAIRRLTAALDARQYHGIPVAAPDEAERAQPYLWRFWRHLPRRGHFAIFDRSWYGRVLVERVEGYCSEGDWQRAYGEINEFEAELDAHGTIVVKFWLQVSKEEQLRRFREREQVAFKNFKITADDWRNRKRWNAYQQAVCDMVDRTSTSVAPWTLVEANNKLYARIKVLATLVERIEQAL
ncbi:MAG: polyphosphate:AMP phosphotransferase [bacterium]|jgi:polyphosphate:AMP phosphotransferase|nr:polyphosphate:AMP phosphotransferase [Betaproteobacteria bacterium]